MADASPASADETYLSQELQNEGSIMSLTKEKRPTGITGGHCGETGGDAGHNEVQASHDRGRRWYHLRPNPRGERRGLGLAPPERSKRESVVSRTAAPRCLDAVATRQSATRLSQARRRSGSSSHDRLKVTDEPVDSTLSPVLEESTAG